ncbi:probable E3 ubiquitin-protein ligase HERC1 [Tachysurus ichikawai]
MLWTFSDQRLIPVSYIHIEPSWGLPMNGLPTAQTCFFQLRLPPYTSQTVLAERLRYSIHNCPSIDMDNYMLSRNTEPTDGSDTEY